MHSKYEITDHLCRNCGGRILRCLDTGMSPGGNPMFRCADCGESSYGHGPDCVCWCGFNHRNQTMTAYRCLPFSILKEYPDLLKCFLACGCDPERNEVGIVLENSYFNIIKNAKKEGA